MTSEPPTLRVPASIAKNCTATVHGLPPEPVEALRGRRQVNASANDYAFRGTAPRIPTFKCDQKAAGFPFEDVRGSRIDLHGLRTIFITQL
jgi:hypothetical protein